MRARIAVIYYSATGNVHGLAQAVAEGAEDAGAEVRLRHVEELASELLISQNQHWRRHRSRVADAPTATLDDLEWADGIAFGTPTRFGNVAAQLKQFIDQAGRLWQEGKLADKVATSFTSSYTPHGGQESTILALNNTLYHWGMLILPLGYTVHEVFAAGGNPYGASFVSDHSVAGPDAAALDVARYQGERLADYAAVVAHAARAGTFAVKRPSPQNFRGAALAWHSARGARSRNLTVPGRSQRCRVRGFARIASTRCAP
jgi:NAD(P)H dehydrogenase (quinone)